MTQTEHDLATGTYIKDLIAGVKKRYDPESFGVWLPIIEQLNSAFMGANGNREFVLTKTLGSLIASKKFPGLAELVQDIIPLDSPKEKQKKPEVQVISNEVTIPPLPDGIAFSPETSRGACPLREDYVRYSESVSPEGYHEFHDGAWWSMLSTIAARRIYSDFSTPLYTPLYIILTARTSLYAKSVTAEVKRTVLAAAGLDWLLGADRTTPQKLMSDLAGKYIPDDYGKLLPEEQELLKMRLAMSGQIGWINDEFGKFVKGMLRQNSVMNDFQDLFLTFDNCPDKYRNATIARSSEPIHQPYLTMLGCMTFASIRDNAKAGSEFWSDGFWPRCAFITPPPGTSKDSPFTRGRKYVPGILSTSLHEWHKRLGVPVIELVESIDEKGKPTGKYEKRTIEERKETKIEVSDEAYDGWVRYRSALKKMLEGIANEDFDGSYKRLPAKAIRIATLAASLQGSTRIELRHWALAQEVAESWRASLHRMYEQVNNSSNVETMEDKVLAATYSLLEKGMESVSARDVGRVLHKDSRDITSYLRTLAKGEELEEIPGRQNPRYKKPEQGV